MTSVGLFNILITNLINCLSWVFKLIFNIYSYIYYNVINSNCYRLNHIEPKPDNIKSFFAISQYHAPIVIIVGILLLIFIVVIFLAIYKNYQYKTLKGRIRVMSIHLKNLESDIRINNKLLNSLEAYTWILNFDSDEVYYINSPNIDSIGFNAAIPKNSLLARTHPDDLEFVTKEFEECRNGEKETFDITYRVCRNPENPIYELWRNTGLVVVRSDFSGRKFTALEGISFLVDNLKQIQSSANINSTNSKK